MPVCYIVRPGNIAAVCHVDTPDNTLSIDFIFLAEGKIPVTSPRDDVQAFIALPLAVQEAVNAHFKRVFSTPVAERGALLRALQSTAVWVDA
jgi:hypothetical protein